MAQEKDYNTATMIEEKGDSQMSIPTETHLEKVASTEAEHRNELGQDAVDLEGYWGSWPFIGSISAIILMANSLFVGYAMPVGRPHRNDNIANAKQVNVLTVINADIGPSPNIYLVTMCFTLVSGVLLLVVGRVSDVVGRRYFFIGTQVFAVVGSIIGATASNVNTLIGATVLTGVAGAGQQLYPLISQEMVPNKHRFLMQGAISMSVFPTLGFAPLIARVLVDKTALGWRWCYWLNVIVGGLSLILFIVCYFPPNFHMINSEKTKMQELKELDYGGLILYSAGLVLVMLSFTWAEGTYAWKSAQVIAPLVIGVVTICAFVAYEAYMPLKQPLLPLRLFKHPNIVPVVFVGCVGQMVYYALNVLFPQQIANLFTTSNILIGLMSVSGSTLDPRMRLTSLAEHRRRIPRTR